MGREGSRNIFAGSLCANVGDDAYNRISLDCGHRNNLVNSQSLALLESRKLI